MMALGILIGLVAGIGIGLVVGVWFIAAASKARGPLERFIEFNGDQL